MTTRDVSPSAGPVAYFTNDHRRCDALWADVEAAADAGDGGRAASAFATFDAAMRRHLELEEQVLFPAFERVTGMTQGPTQVMRYEHEQMRGVLQQMAAAAKAGGWDEVVDLGDTLNVLIQQHNMKEEGILYPMAEQHLRGHWADVAAELSRR